MSEQDVYDVTIIGGGPTGLFTAFYSGMRGLKVKIIESMPQLGGQLSALYPEKYIYDVAGFPKVRAQDLVDNLVRQMQMFEQTVVLDQSVETVHKLNDETFRLETNQEVHYSRTIIIAAGVGAFQPRKLKVEEAVQYEGRNLHYFIDNINAFKNKDVLICGGGDSAVDWTLMLANEANVTLTHRRDKFRAHEHSVAELQSAPVQTHTPFEVSELRGNGKKIEQVVLQEVKGTDQKVVNVDNVIVNYGFISSLGPIKTWGLDTTKNSVIVNSRMETNIPGIYAAGDITSFDGKVKLIATGFGDAPTAVSNAKSYMDPNARLQPGHSTHMF
ncbi:NAD(P)/FAD-dependent oxidoreductase [Salicibibacter cibarius]|uniref:Ferredoxin--NADP reductase n=1 Tax=Salicibibacter cibarius TaxID=2743000 RepID=A0A7T6Z0B7_9BACI|nr:NAD(P)/FAD-dependent oxidoreductase [Salicibibacter cibarius]QQK74453.1 NAD(P)/FAD-dependent oxidoreductase [Salicibibacter cibarius]